MSANDDQISLAFLLYDNDNYSALHITDSDMLVNITLNQVIFGIIVCAKIGHFFLPVIVQHPSKFPC